MKREDLHSLNDTTLLLPVVDVQPVYMLLPVLANPDGYPPETIAFVRMKLKSCADDLRQTAKQIEKRLSELPGEEQKR